jgi:hypothetical protein
MPSRVSQRYPETCIFLIVCSSKFPDNDRSTLAFQKVSTPVATIELVSLTRLRFHWHTMF